MASVLASDLPPSDSSSDDDERGAQHVPPFAFGNVTRKGKLEADGRYDDETRENLDEVGSAPSYAVTARDELGVDAVDEDAAYEGHQNCESSRDCVHDSAYQCPATTNALPLLDGQPSDYNLEGQTAVEHARKLRRIEILDSVDDLVNLSSDENDCVDADTCESSGCKAPTEKNPPTSCSNHEEVEEVVGVPIRSLVSDDEWDNFV